MIARALSVLQPYAELIANGTKHIETRSWKTNYRGLLFIHASGLRIPKYARDNEVLMRLADEKAKEIRFGSIICSCLLEDCVEMNDAFIEYVKRNSDEYTAGIYSPGRYAWILKDVKPVTPIPMKGQLGIWKFEMEEYR